jgi:hypothetical protein
MLCEKCDSNNSKGSKFCSSCGSKLERTGEKFVSSTGSPHDDGSRRSSTPRGGRDFFKEKRQPQGIPETPADASPHALRHGGDSKGPSDPRTGRDFFKEQVVLEGALETLGMLKRFDRDTGFTEGMAIASLKEGDYIGAVQSARMTESSRGKGAGALAAHALTREAEEREDLDGKLNWAKVEVRFALDCNEELPRASAAFDAAVIGTWPLNRGDKPEESVIWLMAAVVLGYSSRETLQGRDGMELAALNLGIEFGALENEDHSEEHSELIQNLLTKFENAIEESECFEVDEYLDTEVSWEST